MKTLVIAEAGSSWWRDYERMIMLIQIAAEAGASAVKFQWASNGQKVAEYRHAPELAAVYQQYLQWPEEWHEQLHHDAEKHHIEYMCTVYLSEDLPVIAPYVRRFKIGSFEATDHAFLQAHASYKKSILISHGMGLAHGGFLIDFPVSRQKFLHCVSAYPAPLEQMNLAAIRNHDYDGLSDHSCHLLTGAFAVCAGAKIIEVHFRLDDTPPDNPDYPHSLTPAQLKTYVENVRLAEKMMGDGVKKVQESERVNLKYRVKP